MQTTPMIHTRLKASIIFVCHATLMMPYDSKGLNYCSMDAHGGRNVGKGFTLPKLINAPT